MIMEKSPHLKMYHKILILTEGEQPIRIVSLSQINLANKSQNSQLEFLTKQQRNKLILYTGDARILIFFGTLLQIKII